MSQFASMIDGFLKSDGRLNKRLEGQFESMSRLSNKPTTKKNVSKMDESDGESETTKKKVEEKPKKAKKAKKPKKVAFMDAEGVAETAAVAEAAMEVDAEEKYPIVEEQYATPDGYSPVIDATFTPADAPVVTENDDAQIYTPAPPSSPVVNKKRNAEVAVEKLDLDAQVARQEQAGEAAPVTKEVVEAAKTMAKRQKKEKKKAVVPVVTQKAPQIRHSGRPIKMTEALRESKLQAQRTSRSTKKPEKEQKLTEEVGNANFDRMLSPPIDAGPLRQLSPLASQEAIALMERLQKKEEIELLRDGSTNSLTRGDRMNVLMEMNLTTNSVFFDAGSGTGCVVLSVAALHGAAAIGVDWNKALVQASNEIREKMPLGILKATRFAHFDLHHLTSAHLDKLGVTAFYALDQVFLGSTFDAVRNAVVGCKSITVVASNSDKDWIEAGFKLENKMGVKLSGAASYHTVYILMR